LELLKTKEEKINLVYLDPPYDKEHNVLIIQYLTENDLLAKGARIVVEAKKEDSLPDIIGTVQKYKEATYGITTIHYFQEVL
jgi:16S rRNA G966 N2-methylase RsmD